MSAFLLSTASYLPEKFLKNEQLTQFPPNVLPLIAAKTGVLSRHKAGEKESSSMLATIAAKRCLEKIGFNPQDLDAVVLATSTPDRSIPATATKVAHNIGAKNAFAFDVNSVCSGSVFLLEIARSFISSASAKNVLVVAVDCYSKILNPSDFSTFPYFGDGAAAALVSESTSKFELKAGVLHSDGAGYDAVTVRGGGSEIPFAALENKTDAFFRMDGRAIFDFATSKGPEVIAEIIAKQNISKNDILSVILHQANINILNKISEISQIPREKFFSNLERIGNTASASVLLALDEFLTSKSENMGCGNIIMASFGGGLSWGASVLSVQ